MSEYKRLTQWTENGASLDLGDPKSDMEARQALMVQFKKACNKLAELEDKLEEGTLVELPCKVGDTVYIVGRKYRAGSYESFINTGKFRYSDIEKFGDIVFITREAAEARLKELEEKVKESV